MSSFIKIKIFLFLFISFLYALLDNDSDTEPSKNPFISERQIAKEKILDLDNHIFAGPIIVNNNTILKLLGSDSNINNFYFFVEKGSSLNFSEFNHESIILNGSIEGEVISGKGGIYLVERKELLNYSIVINYPKQLRKIKMKCIIL